MDVVSMQQRALSFLSSSASSSAVSRCLHIPPRFCVGVWVSVCSIYKYIAAADAAVLMTGIKYLQRSLKGPFSRAVSLSLSLSLTRYRGFLLPSYNTCRAAANACFTRYRVRRARATTCDGSVHTTTDAKNIFLHLRRLLSSKNNQSSRSPLRAFCCCCCRRLYAS